MEEKFENMHELTDDELESIAGGYEYHSSYARLAVSIEKWQSLPESRKARYKIVEVRDGYYIIVSQSTSVKK